MPSAQCEYSRKVWVQRKYQRNIRKRDLYNVKHFMLLNKSFANIYSSIKGCLSFLSYNICFIFSASSVNNTYHFRKNIVSPWMNKTVLRPDYFYYKWLVIIDHHMVTVQNKTFFKPIRYLKDFLWFQQKWTHFDDEIESFLKKILFIGNLSFYNSQKECLEVAIYALTFLCIQNFCSCTSTFPLELSWDFLG